VRGGQFNDGDPAAGQVLLIPDVTIGSDHDRETGRLCRLKQVAIRQGIPSHLRRRGDFPGSGETAKSDRRVSGQAVS
jgi:hypothetical protein